jgi:hypothetical protein
MVDPGLTVESDVKKQVVVEESRKSIRGIALSPHSLPNQVKGGQSTFLAITPY